MTKEVQLNIENNKEKYCSICGEVLDIEKMEVLDDIVYNGYVDTQEMDIKKITLPDGKVTFDFDNLILQ